MKNYEQPLIVSLEQGFTYSLDSNAAYDLNESIGMNMVSAVVPGADIVLDSTVGYNQAAKASHSATAFKSVMATKLEGMIKSANKRLEIALLYGNDKIASASLQTVTIANSMLPLVIDSKEWATGIFAGMEGTNVVFAKSSDLTAVDSLRSFKIAKVDVEAKTIYLAVGTAGTPGTLTTLQTAIQAFACNMYFYGAVSGSAGTFAFSEMAGLKKIITNTGSLFGVDSSVYNLWKGNTISAGSAVLTMDKVVQAIGKAVQKGLDEDVVCLVNPSTWADLASNLAALRKFDGSYSRKKGTNGVEELEYASQNGTVKIVAYNLVKEGDCFIFPPSKAMRIGARELSLNDPTRGQDEIFFHIPGKAGIGIRAYTNQALFIEAPCQCVYINNIVNSL